ncbi:MAG: transposase [Planctomycetaceae bacterium]|nr:transposase [Planctomycetaceae bacterium]
MNDAPLAYFITFTVYGTFLQGDARWWRSRNKGARAPQPLLEQWHRDRLKHEVILLDDEQRIAVEKEIKRLCEFRGWQLWKANSRTNHVHVVVTASGYDGAKVRDQIKANCTRVVRERWPLFADRPVWTVGGHYQCVNTVEDLDQVVLHAGEVQDRKDRDMMESAARR